MAAYILLASETTVQVLSPTVVTDVLYCTIQTQPSNAVVSITIPYGTDPFTNTSGRLQLLNNAVEEVLALDHVTAAVGSQTLDANGLLVDNVTFTVEYFPPANQGTSITADAVVPVSVLVANQSGPSYQADISGAEAIIDPVYDGLVSISGG